MSADNLPRPDVAGPWRAPDNPNLAGVVLGPDGRTQIAQCAPDLVPVLCALPERIRRMDAVRAWCEDQIGQCDEARARGEIEMAHMVLRAAAARVRALLDGEAGE